MADRAIVDRAVEAAPKDYLVAANVELALKAVGATFNGASAAGPFLPAVQLVAPDETVMFTAVPEEPVAAGGSAVVSWFPGGGVEEAAASGGGSGGTVTNVSSPGATLSVGNPSGPAVTLDVAPSGVAAGTYGDALDVGQFTVDAEGRITAAAAVPIASGAGGGIVQVSKVALTSGDLTTSSATFVDATGLTTTITTGAHRCVVIFTAAGHAPGVNNNLAVDLAIDGTRQGQAYGLVITQAANANVHNENLSFVYVTDALSAASHTFKIQWRVDAGTGTMFASTGVTPAILTVLELGV